MNCSEKTTVTLWTAGCCFTATGWQQCEGLVKLRSYLSTIPALSQKRALLQNTCHPIQERGHMAPNAAELASVSKQMRWTHDEEPERMLAGDGNVQTD